MSIVIIGILAAVVLVLLYTALANFISPYRGKA